QRFDVVISNPPYVADGDPHLQRLRHEPLTALVAGHDGLADIGRIADAARAHLTAAGWLLLEHGADQGAAVAARLAALGYAQVQTRRDYAGCDRITLGQWGHAD